MREKQIHVYCKTEIIILRLRERLKKMSLLQVLLLNNMSTIIEYPTRIFRIGVTSKVRITVLITLTNRGVHLL
jgi:hypothetical protein